MKKMHAAAVLALVLSAVAMAEKVVYLEEFDRFGENNALFNDGAGLAENKNGCLCLKFRPIAPSDFRKGCFPVATPPAGDSWTLSFLYRFDADDVPHDFVFKLWFGDKSDPAVVTLAVSENGSHFGPGRKPAPADGAHGFLCKGNWNKGAITVSGRTATFWTYRGGVLVEECETSLPDAPLVGWNFGVADERCGAVSLDRVCIVDGVARPYDRGDPTEWLPEVAAAPRDKWDASFGTCVTNKAPMPVDFSRNRLVLKFRGTFEAARNAGATVFFNCETGAPVRVAFNPSRLDVKIEDRVCKDGVFANVTTPVSFTNEFLAVGGDKTVMERERIFARPAIGNRMRYLQREINEIYAAYGKLPKISERVFTLEAVRLRSGKYRVFVDGQVLCELAPPSPIVSVNVAGLGVEARAAELPAPAEPDPQIYRLPLPEGGFKLERVRENQGTYALECNAYLSRNGFDAMPSSCLFNVPKRQYIRAKAVCKIDEGAPETAVPVITARLTHFYANGGRTMAMCEKTIDLRDGGAAVVKKGDLYEVTFDFNPGEIQDLVSMTDGMARRELAYLHFEFTGPLWEKNRYYMDFGRIPAQESVSSLIVLSGELEASPADMTAVANIPFSLYYPDEEAGATVTVTPRLPGLYKVVAEVRDEDGKVVETQKMECDARLGAMRASEDFTRKFVFAAKPYGYYDVDYVLTDADGIEIQRHSASFGRIRPDTRKAGYESPYYSWNFRGAHGTPSQMADWAVAYRRLGIRRTTLASRFTGADNREYREDSPECLKYGFTHVQFPYVRPPVFKDDADRAAFVDRLQAMTNMYPHCRTALVFHESGGGPYPVELHGGVTKVDDAVRAGDAEKVATALRLAEAWREADPGVKLIYGNSGSTLGLVARLMRGGFPKELFDAMGEESVGMSEPPEMTTAMLPWKLKKLARLYGYPENMDCPREWKGRYYPWRYEKDKTPAAGMAVRDALIAHALGYTVVPIGAGTETANSYADTIWCSGTFARWPLAYPRKAALAFATLTQVLDGAKFVRQVPTGSPTVYALEFETAAGLVYALWDSRGETEVAAKSSGKVVSMTGRELGGVRSGRLRVGEEPCYIVDSAKIEAFDAAKTRAFPRERYAGKASEEEVVAVDLGSAPMELACVTDKRVEIPFDANPRRPGAFSMKTVDDERGACVEITHLSRENCPETLMEYATIRFKDPQPVEGEFSTIGAWVKGNSNWGRLFFEIEDAEGEKWFSGGEGGVGCDVYDWPARMSFNYDGWNYLQMPLTWKSPVKVPSPGDNEWQWTRDGTGNGRIDFPVKVTGLVVGQFGRTLNLLDMCKGEPSIRIKSVSLW